jgi:hypothetical protein
MMQRKMRYKDNSMNFEVNKRERIDAPLPFNYDLTR